MNAGIKQNLPKNFGLIHALTGKFILFFFFLYQNSEKNLNMIINKYFNILGIKKIAT